MLMGDGQTSVKAIYDLITLDVWYAIVDSFEWRVTKKGIVKDGIRTRASEDTGLMGAGTHQALGASSPPLTTMAP
jgi:hypothetical protein